MENKPLPIDILATRLGNDISEYIRNWMRGAKAEDIDFHRYRMRLFSLTSTADSVTEKLVMLADKTSPRLRFEILEVTGDKVMGESISRYIFARIMVILNESYQKVLEHEVDRVKSEINILLDRSSGLKTKIGQH